mmetsp:Transcript_4661/g.5380  ORF Transcript_4661/g.5380 Transcript_4661/m.5380 type:complete len:264 (-) Transcript_4661:125-916(-)
MKFSSLRTSSRYDTMFGLSFSSFFSILTTVITITTRTTTNAFSPTGPIALNISFKNVLPEKRDEFLKGIRNDAQKVVETEPSSLQYVFGEDVDTPNIFYLHEQYDITKMSDEECDLLVLGDRLGERFDELRDFCKNEDGPVIEIVSYRCNHEANKIPQRSAYCLNVNFFIQDAVREEFLTLIQNNQKGSTEEEELCLQYHLGENAASSNIFHLHEEYTGKDDGKEGFDAHIVSKHFKAWEEFSAKEESFTNPPVVQFYKTMLL